MSITSIVWPCFWCIAIPADIDVELKEATGVFLQKR